MRTLSVWELKNLTCAQTSQNFIIEKIMSREVKQEKIDSINLLISGSSLEDFELKLRSTS